MGLNNLKIKSKLTLLIVLGCLALITVGGVAFSGISRLSTALNQSNREFKNISRYGELEKRFLNVRLCVAYILFLTDAGKMKNKSDEMEKHLDEIKKTVGELTKDSVDSKERELLSSFQDGIQLYVQGAVKLGGMAQAAVVSAKPEDRVEMVGFATSTVAPLAKKPTELLADLALMAEKKIKERSEVNSSDADKVRTTILLVIAVSLCMSVLIGILAGRSLICPIVATVSRLRDISEGEGDLTARIEVKGKDELGDLAGHFNGFVGKLQTIIADVAATASSIATTAGQLHSTSDQIATGAEVVAGQSNTVATASEEMSHTSSDIARNCCMAAEASQHATQSATNGAAIVQETISGMALISERVQSSAKTVEALGARSEQIGAIVGTIEDIAEQTNLLALNAAIEAARAGDQGRGFAVVADEVRALAERTTKATREIGDMIKAIQKETGEAVKAMEEGVREVEKGAETSQKSGHALEDILERINEVSMQINQIATAAEEQTATTSEVSSNILQITEVVNQTAHGAEETACAAAQLAGQARQMQTLVGRFRLA